MIRQRGAQTFRPLTIPASDRPKAYAYSDPSTDLGTATSARLVAESGTIWIFQANRLRLISNTPQSSNQRSAQPRHTAAFTHADGLAQYFAIDESGAGGGRIFQLVANRTGKNWTSG